MGGPFDELMKAMYGIKPDPPPEKGSLSGLSKLYGLTPPPVETSPLVDLFFSGSNKTVPAPLPANNSLFDLLLKSKNTTPPPAPRISRVSDVASHPLARLRIPPPPPTATEPGVPWCDGVVRESLQQKATITAGRVLGEWPTLAHFNPFRGCPVQAFLGRGFLFRSAGAPFVRSHHPSATLV